MGMIGGRAADEGWTTEGGPRASVTCSVGFVRFECIDYEDFLRHELEQLLVCYRTYERHLMKSLRSYELPGVAVLHYLNAING